MRGGRSISLQGHLGLRDEGHEKRRRSHGETSEDWPGRPRHPHLSQHSPTYVRGGTYDSTPSQLPSPALIQSIQDPPQPQSPGNGTKRKARSHSSLPPPKRPRVQAETGPVGKWLAGLPCNNTFETHDHMSRPPAKRSRSTDSVDGRLSQSGDGSDTVVSEGKKYSVYQNANYDVILETKNSFMRSSKQGMAAADRELCERLFAIEQPVPQDMLFDDDHFRAFHANLRGRSEARICADLHPRIVPSVENLYIGGREEFEGLVEGHNDPWIKSIPFYGPRPQPDHTIGYRWSNFDEQQRRRLNVEPMKKSLYTAREDIYFPFLTAEVKCGKQGLDLADRPNAHSMTVQLRGVVDLARRAGRPEAVHRRVLGFSISHDDIGARVYAHYPELDGDTTTYWRDTLEAFTFTRNKGADRWMCHRFTLNVCQVFAPSFLARLKELIDELPEIAAQSFGLSAPFAGISMQSSQDDASATESPDEGFKKPSSGRGLNVELRNIIQSLQRQLEQQRQDMEQERRETKERELMLQTQVKQQRKESEERQKESEERQKESEKRQKESEKGLMELLKQQSEQIRILLQR